MGGCIGRKNGGANVNNDAEFARRQQQLELRNAQQQPLVNGQTPQQYDDGRGRKSRGQSSQQFAGQGQVLGGDVSAKAIEDRRQLQLEAAEARAKAIAGRGGVSEKKAKELEENHVKEDLIGKIQAYCAMRKKEEPLGLRLASVEQLRDTLRQLQQGV
mmetsp:Transcript_2585/g.6009  ORF Transcript_2585/g.6009 Transcript_2585/m.6009 type:complete len:158 (+) Transcript_2585:151-624(+)